MYSIEKSELGLPFGQRWHIQASPWLMVLHVVLTLRGALSGLSSPGGDGQWSRLGSRPAVQHWIQYWRKAFCVTVGPQTGARHVQRSRPSSMPQDSSGLQSRDRDQTVIEPFSSHVRCVQCWPRCSRVPSFYQGSCFHTHPFHLAPSLQQSRPVYHIKACIDGQCSFPYACGVGQRPRLRLRCPDLWPWLH